MADTDKARAAQADAEAQVARNEALLPTASGISSARAICARAASPSEAAYDTARTSRDAQQAALNSARAQVNSTKARSLGLAADLQVAKAHLAAVTAQIAQREATVRQIEVDLRNTDIRSPVFGVVVQRNVELGQTVAASLQAPTLFLIADDLRRMEIAANIDETDVGRIKPGQRVTFTVTAFPGRTFEGTVKQVRLGSQTVQNVVIYTTIVSIENPRLELLPGMTATLRIETDRRDAVVRVPNAALRWRPPAIVPDASVSHARSRRHPAKSRALAEPAAIAHHGIRRSDQDRAQSQRRADQGSRCGVADMRKPSACRRGSRIKQSAAARPRRAAGPGRAHHGASSPPSSVRSSKRSRSA